MKIIETKLSGLKIIELPVFKDYRGEFIKNYNYDSYRKAGLCTDFKECFYSLSKKDVIRGMHFQFPPFDHDKLVYVSKGRITDVILDLRSSLETFGNYLTFDLSEENNHALFIPKGCAHGFKSLEDNSIVHYHVSTVYSQEHDSGIRYDSFGYNWKIDEPVISERDRSFIEFSKFKSPF